MKVRVIRRIYDFLEQSNAKNVILYGGAGAGKSYTLAQFFIFERLLKYKNKRFLFTRKYNPSLRLSVVKLVREMLHEYQIPFEENKSEQVFSFPYMRSEIVFRGIDDAEKLKSAEFNYIWLEEATEFDFEDYQQLRLRLRRVNAGQRNQIYLTFNPIGQTNWIYEYFFEKKQPDTQILHTNYLDNPFLDKEYINILQNLKEQDHRFYKIYTLGEFAELDHLIYTNWDIINEPPRSFDDIIYGLDFGYNNPTCLLKIGWRDQEIYILDELYQTHLTNSELIERLKELDVSKNSPIFADSAEPDRIKEIQQAGYWIQGVAKNVKNGIDQVKRRKIHILSHCVNTIREIKNYSWRKKGDIILDEPVKFDDHSLDSLRYAVTGYLEQSKPSIRMLDV